MLDDAIGGYFGLELPLYPHPWPQAIGFQSARAAIRAALEQAGIQKAWLPAYICDSVVDAVTQAGCEIGFFCLNDDWLPENLPCPGKKSAVLLVNYFGLIRHRIEEWFAQYEAKWPLVIVDNSQSMSSAPLAGAINVYSPRKFAGLPDGGLLIGGECEAIGSPKDEDSLARMEHLFRRAATGAHSGYEAFQAAEQSLNDSLPVAMSSLTERLLFAQDWQVVFKQRKCNFNMMHEFFDEEVAEYFYSSGDAPLVYPLRLEKIAVHSVRQSLSEKGIFCPHYWPDCLKRESLGRVEKELLNSYLFLPIDQRMSVGDVKNTASVVNKILEGCL